MQAEGQRRGRGFGAAVATAFLAACHQPDAPPSAPRAVVDVPAPTSIRATPRPAVVEAADPCRDRPRCDVTTSHDAGVSAAGRPMFVVEVTLGMRSEGEPDSPVRDCEQREVWLVHHRGPRDGDGLQLPPPRLLLALCNDGYGASGVGEDEIVVRPNELVHTRFGGSSWRWSTGTKVQLDPPAVVDDARSSWWSLSQHHEWRSSFDYRTFQGFDAKTWPACDAAGRLPDLGDVELPSIGSQPIPATSLPVTLSTGDVNAAAAIDVAPCATRGESPEVPGDSAYAFVIDTSTSTLLAQIRDDTFTASDRLLVWSTSAPARDGLHCWQSQRITPLEVSLEGHIVAGAAAHPGATVEVGRGGDATSRLVRIHLGAMPEAISIKYRDVDPKGRGGIATSDVEDRKGERIYMGRVAKVDPLRATCVLAGGALVPRASDPPPHDVAFLGDP